MRIQLAIATISLLFSFFTARAQSMDSTSNTVDSLSLIVSDTSTTTKGTYVDTLTTKSDTTSLEDKSDSSRTIAIDSSIVSTTDSSSAGIEIIQDTLIATIDSSKSDTIVLPTEVLDSVLTVTDSVQTNPIQAIPIESTEQIDTTYTQPIDTSSSVLPAPSATDISNLSTDSSFIQVPGTTIDTSSAIVQPEVITTDSLNTNSSLSIVVVDSLPTDTVVTIDVDSINIVSFPTVASIDSTTIRQDSLSPLNIDTLLTVIEDSAASITPVETVSPDVPVAITGDPLIDSIMNAGVQEMAAHSPNEPTNSVTPDKFSVEDLPEEISFVIHAYDSITKEPLRANITMITMDKAKNKHGSGICNSQGFFSFFLTPRSHFELTISVPDYTPITEEMDLSVSPIFTPILKKNYPMKKFEIGDVIQLKNINFKQGDFHLQREAFPVLDKLAKMMLQNPKMVIRLKGHTDNTGSPSANLKLSNDRITEVRYYLLRQGIKLNRLKGQGYGGSQPLVPNNSPENMKKNRRVEFEILKI